MMFIILLLCLILYYIFNNYEFPPEADPPLAELPIVSIIAYLSMGDKPFDIHLSRVYNIPIPMVEVNGKCQISNV